MRSLDVKPIERKASMVAPVAQRESPECRANIGFVQKTVLLVFLSAWCAAPAVAADLAEGEALFRSGHYDECARLAAVETGKGAWNEGWSELKIKAELARGKSAAAILSLGGALRRFPASVSLRLLGRDVYRSSGRDEDAATEMDMIEKLVLSAPQRYAAPESRLALGRFFLVRGADARKVLDQFYDVVTKERPDFVDAYLATAELALDKQDYALAAETLRKAPKNAAQEPRFHYLLARAFAADDRALSAKELSEALKINPHHTDSLLLQTDHLIDAERYTEAGQVLKQVFDVNPVEPRAWAYRAVLAHLKGDRDAEAAARRSALAQWAANPEVDHLIGRKLSQKYRFTEGAASQKRALELDPNDLPAKIQLCQDLLRLGDEAAGWKLAAEIFAKDGYNVVAYNLVTLHDRLSGFRTLEGDGFIVRMEALEADLYGQRVLSLLRRAKKTLCEKYGVTLRDPVIVEIFPTRKEFAVRTFGLPGADGLLGVCFGRVVTVSGPAAQGKDPSNWEAILWHEFCHVVTLNKSHNKMPRWLSEGISVYEEEREDPAWRQLLNPRYRAMILGDGLTPLSKLSSAFMAPETPIHLQFAYYESALAVDFFVRKFGSAVLKGLLDDLGAGMDMNESLPARTKTSLEQLDRDFAQFARQLAKSVAPDLTWEEPDLPADVASAAAAAWLEKHPKSFWGWRRLGARLVAEEKWQAAKEVLEKLKGLYPEYTGPENAYVLLATVYRRLSDTAAEHKVLEELAARDGDASPAYLRLMELDEAAGDWRGMAKAARRLLAVNPLVPTPHRQLARAAEQLGERDEAVAAYRALALLDDTDPADVHYRLAKLLRQGGKSAEARREVLKSLEEAPRFLDSHRLLLELLEQDAPAAGSQRPGFTGR
jgi:Tfp pilus assembly protein PilF/DNA-binding SARP family transcriptional activator